MPNRDLELWKLKPGQRLWMKQMHRYVTFVHLEDHPRYGKVLRVSYNGPTYGGSVLATADEFEDESPNRLEDFPGCGPSWWERLKLTMRRLCKNCRKI
jgi:hypothetical protein